MSYDYDIAIIGAGPAGYVAAIRAAQLGKNVCLIEGRETLGGTCLNVGCIPSKALLQSSEKYAEAKHGADKHGVVIDKVKLDLGAMLTRKDDVVKKLTGGLPMLMKKNKIITKTGWATLTGANEINLDDKEKITAAHIIIATGSTPIELPFAPFDHKVVIDSTAALNLAEVPNHLVVIGAGVIGLEMGSVWKRLGANVTVIDIAERPLAIMDADLGKEAHKIFEKQGLEFLLGAKVSAVEVKKNNATVSVETADGKTTKLKADKVLVAVGRKANTSGLGLAEVGVATDERGVIQVKHDSFQTSVPSIYAIGDCIPGPMLAHKGEEEGVALAELLAGQAGHVNYAAIPWVVYTHPEVAGVGKTEEECRKENMDIAIGKFPFAINGRALAMGETEGFVKVIADKHTDKVLGVHIIGANASELIAEAALAMEYVASSEDIARTVHAHPTLSEVLKEAALAVDKRALHM